ncbi:uncharacterized protein LOC111020243 [Momordica charantia]|uniref:Uncharacterized protein LOC111020243 n=1 Tax=Momordica charantia TaxID=3673 RepID=A0A6J1DGJ7_MOMCH|nr:uncharacterized protein LOC111020243 [Momordica charantia]
MGSKEIQFASDYLILKPEEATLLDLFLFVLPFGFKNLRKLVDCPPEKEESYNSFGNRWIIFFSILWQKILLAFLNQHKEKPKTEDPPTVNCKDWSLSGRDKNIKLDDPFQYYAILSVRASALATEDFSPHPSVVETVVNSCWNMKLLGCYDLWNDFQDMGSTQVFMFQNTATDPNVTVVAFRGTTDVYDMKVDLDFSWYEIANVGKIHRGFMEALGLQKQLGWPKELVKPEHDYAYYFLRQQLRDIAKSNDKARFIITGHSLGAALATLFVTILAFHEELDLLEKLKAVYTFGQPRVGDVQFVQFMENVNSKVHKFPYYRYVYSMDVVPRIPFDVEGDQWYKHFGGCLYYDCNYTGEFLEEEPNKNYLSIPWLIPKYLYAWWELLRSLLLPVIMCNPDYFETSQIFYARVFGLFIPGASAHNVVNYIYSARWGKIVCRDTQKKVIPADYLERC